jgi:23S rRNA (adenine2503-C2)-methyltransferase
MTNNSIKSLTTEELATFCESLNVPQYRTKQLTQWLYKHGVDDYSQMLNLPSSLREKLAEQYCVGFPTVKERLESKDGSRKYLLELYDGELIETVAIPSNKRLTVCFSTQVGCALGCVFCATGKLGFRRNLGAGEIVDQLSVVERDFGRRITNAVAMGQGEPFLNFEATLSALRIMNSESGKAIGARHLSVSTSGFLSGIYALSEVKEQYTLAVSLHSAVQTTRDSLMPALSKQPLGDLRAALLYYTKNTGRRVSLEYSPIEGINDDEDEILALISFCKGLNCHVNIIPFNNFDVKSSSNSIFNPTKKSHVNRIVGLLARENIDANIRQSAGSDIQGACGQLALGNSK